MTIEKKLPSGKWIEVPDGLTEQQASEWIFNRLENVAGYEEDRKVIGDLIDTSGWGSTIGSVIGGVAGGIGGIFTSPSLVVNPITLGVAGSGVGAGLGEALEQWITGKGSYGDIARHTAEGAAWGVVPGVGGQVAKGIAKGGGRAALQIAGSSASGAATGAGIGAGSAGLTGTDVRTGAGAGAVAGVLTGAGRGGTRIVSEAITKELSGVVKKAQDKISRELGSKSTGTLFGDIIAAGSKYLTGWIKKMAGRPTGAFAMAEAKRDAYKAFLSEARRFFTRTTGRAPQGIELQAIEEIAKKQVDKSFLKHFRFREDISAAGEEILETVVKKPKGNIITHKGVEVLEDAKGHFYNPKTGAFIEHFNKGGEVKETLGTKIGILKNEGYPTKQAVAIAYDMRRRGELS